MIDMSKLKDLFGNLPGTNYGSGSPPGVSKIPSTPGMTPSTQATGGGGGYSGGWTPPSNWGAYNLWNQGSADYDPNEFAWGGATPQDWWRSPDMAGGIIYNDYYGWQEADPVRDWYRQFQTAPTSQQFTGAGWNPQGAGTTDVNSWQQYYPGRNTDAGWQSQGYTWDEAAQQWVQGGGGASGGTNPLVDSGGNNSPYVPSYTPYSNDPYFTTQELSPQYPQEWDTASNVLSDFARTGMPTPVPNLWNLGGVGATNMASTGMPTSNEAWYQNAKQVAQTDIEDAIKQASEQANLRGIRWSTPLGRSAQDIAGRRMTELGAERESRELASLEAARGRQMGALDQMYQYGAGSAGLAESAANRGLSAAGQLPGVGSLYAQYPMQLAERAAGIGSGLQGAQQQEIQSLLQEFLRTTPEASPWLTYALQSVGMPFQSAPEMYQPSAFTQGAGAAGGLAGLFSGCL